MMKQLKRLGTICLLLMMAMVCKAEGDTVVPDSTVVPGDSIVVPGNSIVVPGDSIVVPNDSIVVPGDSIVVPNDSIEVPTDTVKVDDGTLVNVPAKATFAFNLGTAGQVATFGTWGDYFISSNVTLGSNLIIKGIDEKGLGQTLIEPKELQQGEEGGSAADESNAIRFLFKPKNGITFTPTKVSLKATSYETDDGLLDFSWENPNKTTIPLATGVKPNRDDNEESNVSELSYEIKDATVGGGFCGLLVNLYNLEGKQIGFSDIIIEGTLNGKEKEKGIPLLDYIIYNGQKYSREGLFGNGNEATIVMSRKETMISKTNPITAVAKVGEIDSITYSGDTKKCTAIIYLSTGDNEVTYTLTFVRKTSYKLTYVDVDKESVIDESIRDEGESIGQFDVNSEDVNVEEGFKMRGWFHNPEGGIRYTVNDIVTEDITLYAIATEIEEVSTSKRYTFDLTDEYFNAEDHEAFNPFGEGYHWLDDGHGWAFKDGNRIDLLVGPRATLKLSLCKFGQGENIFVRSEAGDTLSVLNGKVENDGDFINYTYEGKPGTLSLCIKASDEMYIHSIDIINIAELNFDKSGNWYYVKSGKADGFTNALYYINEINTDNNSERIYIFLPNGTYDLGETAQTTISRDNVSIIGESMYNTTIVTTPDLALEGLNSAEMFVNSSSNLYLQDITLKNNFDYYSSGSEGRAPVLYDNGNHTVGKNVRMISYQSTYYSFNNGMQSYWDNCDFHGAVDILCGGGDVRINNSTLSLEPRYSDGSGHRTIVSPRTMTKYGHIFDHCKIVDLSEGYGTWDFGHTWSNQPIAVYLSTTLDANAEDGLISSRWTEKGLNNTDPSIFGEYNTMDQDGNDITPVSNSITSYSGIYQTILNADMAAYFSYDKMFSNNAERTWDPATITAQVNGPADARYENGTITWTAVDGAIAYAIYKNGELEAIIEDTSYNLEINPDAYRLSIRCANAMGGFGPEAHVAGTIGIKGVNNDREQDVIYNLQGVRVSKPGKGIYIINGKKTVIK